MKKQQSFLEIPSLLHEERAKILEVTDDTVLVIHDMDWMEAATKPAPVPPRLPQTPPTREELLDAMERHHRRHLKISDFPLIIRVFFLHKLQFSIK